MLQFGQMKHLYLFTLEITPLEVGRIYDELPSHLTLMSRFLSDMSAEEVADKVRPLFIQTAPVHLVFGETIQLGPKKVTAHMVDSLDERRLHDSLRKVLDGVEVEYQYPEFIGDKHKAHITAREGVRFAPGSERTVFVAYLIEVIDGKRIIRAKFTLTQLKSLHRPASANVVAGEHINHGKLINDNRIAFVKPLV